MCWLCSQLCRCVLSGAEGQQLPGVLSEVGAALTALSQGSVHQGHGGTLHPGAKAGEEAAAEQLSVKVFSYMDLAGSMGWCSLSPSHFEDRI